MARKEIDVWLLQMESDLLRLSMDTGVGSPKVARQKAWAPRVDVLDSIDFIAVRAELAGVRSDDIRISIDRARGVLAVRGVREDEAFGHAPGWAAHQLEIEHGPFAREIELPRIGLDLDATKARFKNGMLLVLIPKTVGSSERPEPQKPTRARRSGGVE